MSGHYTLTTAGRFFKKCQKFCQKMAKNRSWGILSEEKCCSVGVQHKNVFGGTNFICMNFNPLRGLPAGTLSGRNNGLLRCYIGFCIRAKTEFSYEESVFARVSNSTQQRMGALQWPENVSAGNPFTGSQYKHIKLFCIIYFFCCTNTEQHFFSGSVPQERFLGIF